MYLLKNNLKNSIAIDVGANIGNHAIFFSNYFHKVYSFEAHPEIFEILRFNTRNNKNINVFNIALFNKIEKMFIISDQIANYGASHISKNFCPQSQQNAFELETKVFSDIFPNLNIKKKISFIKLDVEGVEQEVLQGFKNILSVDSPIICFEQHLKDFKDENNKFTTKTIKFLREFDYDHFLR